jgi:hypothetical protein
MNNYHFLQIEFPPLFHNMKTAEECIYIKHISTTGFASYYIFGEKLLSAPVQNITESTVNQGNSNLSAPPLDLSALLIDLSAPAQNLSAPALKLQETTGLLKHIAQKDTLFYQHFTMK